MIRSITIRDVASFNHEGVALKDLQRVNIVFGGNGTGKTTISRYLKNIKDRILFPDASQYYYHKCNIELDENLDEWDILVYNKDFKEESLKEDMPGIFTLGEDSTMYEYKLVNELMPMVEKYKKNELREEDQQKLLELYKELEGKFDIVKRYMPSVDYINGMLKEHGYANFSIQMSPTEEKCYQIQREDGSFVFESLSEGETTFITFLYFMQIVNNPVDGLDGKKKTLVVIDDPVCSLDAQTMNAVSSLVNQLCDTVRGADENSVIQQVIVMSHNLEFLKQVTTRQKRKDTRNWRLVKQGNVSRVVDFGRDRPVYSGYEHRWEELRKESAKMDTILMQNLMRGIIETYFLKYGGYNKQMLFNGDYLCEPWEKIAVRSFYAWLNSGSHGGIEDLYGGDPQMLNDYYLEMFRRFFVMMGQEEHYNMMMREK